MAVTVPTHYAWQQGNSSLHASKAIRAADLETLRGNSHYLYAAAGLRTATAQVWPLGLKTSSTTAETVLEIPFRFAEGRRAAGLRAMFRRTGSCTVAILIRDAADTTTLATYSGTAGAGSAHTDLTSGITQDDVLIRVQLTVASGSEGLEYLKITELPLTAANLP